MQRHNLVAFGAEEEQAGRIASFEGTAWIERSEEILRGVQVPVSFTRWREWYGTTEYREVHVAFLKLMSEDAEFEETVEVDASSLAERREKRGELVPPRLVDCSRDYVLEELAVFALQSRSLPAAEVYPGTSLQSVMHLRGSALPEVLSPLSTRYVARIDFDRRSAAELPSARSRPAVA